MRLSRPRVVLRIALLAGVGVVFLARAVQGWRGPGADAGLPARLALVQALLAAVAFLAAGAAATALRSRERVPTFRLGPNPFRTAGLEGSGARAAAEPGAMPSAGGANERSAPSGQKEDRMTKVPPGIVDGATAQRLAEDGAVVVDVRTPAEFAAGHVPGARNVPYDQIARRAGEIGPPTTPVVVYCKSGQRSAVARHELRRLGFEQVWDAQRYDAWPR